MNTMADLLIVTLAPIIIIAYLLAALTVYRRKVARGENGIYTAIITTLLIYAVSNMVIEWSYLRNLLGWIDSPEDIFAVRFIRLGLYIAALLNLYQYYRGMRQD